MLADCIRSQINPTVSGARVYSHWVYEIDINTMLGKVTAPMFATTGTSEGKVHCWTLGIQRAEYMRNIEGNPEYVGAHNTRWTWLLTIDVWGLWTYDGTKATQNSALAEARLISAAMFRNAEQMLQEMPLLSDVRPLEFTALQPTPFSDGKQICVAAGVMQVAVSEALGI
jgi:hypothetical protein